MADVGVRGEPIVLALTLVRGEPQFVLFAYELFESLAQFNVWTKPEGNFKCTWRTSPFRHPAAAARQVNRYNMGPYDKLTPAR